MLVSCCLLLLTGLSGLEAALPDFITPCARNDPDFNACALKSAKEGIAPMAKGNRKLGIPSLMPLKLPELKLAEGAFNLALQNLNIYGLDKAIPDRADFDFKKKVFALDFTIPEFRIESDYTINGKILLLPITGNGDFNCTMVNGKLKMSHIFALKKINGKDHQKIENLQTKFTPERVYMTLTNLFNGDALIGREMNTFLNENWKEVYQELSPRIEDTFASIMDAILTKVNDAIPFDEVFPPSL